MQLTDTWLAMARVWVCLRLTRCPWVGNGNSKQCAWLTVGCKGLLGERRAEGDGNELNGLVRLRFSFPVASSSARSASAGSCKTAFTEAKAAL